MGEGGEIDEKKNRKLIFSLRSIYVVALFFFFFFIRE